VYVSATIAVRELRNNGSQVLARVQAGETLTITSAGKPVAELRPLSTPPRPRLTAQELISRRRGIGRVDPDRMKAEIDAMLDGSL
jgi:prevent-host-death family protein